MIDVVTLFGCCDIIFAPVTGLLVYLEIQVELVHEVLDIILVLDGQEDRLEALIQGPIIVALVGAFLY